MSNVGKIIWNREHKEKGIVINESERYCAVCGRHSCLIVKWEYGKKQNLVHMVLSVFLTEN